MVAPILKAFLKGGSEGVDDAVRIIRETDVNQTAPTVVEPESGTPTKLPGAVVRNEAKKELKKIREPEPAVAPEEPVTPPTAGEPPSKPLEAQPVVQPNPEFDAEQTAERLSPDLDAQAKELSEAEFDPELQGGAAGPEVEQLNFDNITSFDDVKAVEQKIASGMKPEIDEARRGVMANEQLNALADDLGLQKEVVEQVLKREQGDVLNPEQMLAARKVLQASAERLKGLADKVATGEASGLDKLEFQKQLLFHRQYYTGFMGARAEAGRLLNTFKIPVGTEEGAVNRMLELSENAQGVKVEEYAKLIRGAESITEINKLTDNRNLLQKGVFDPAFEIFVNGILSGVRTQEVNMLSNGVFQLMQAAELEVAGQMARLSNRADKVYVGEGVAHIAGAVQAFQDALKFAKRAFKEGEALDNVEKFETVGRRKAISSDSFDILQKNDPATHAVARVVDLFGALIRLPTERGLTPGDELFKTFATRAKLSSLAFREASAQLSKKAVTPEEAQRMYADLLRNPTKQIIEQSADHSYEVTFQKALGENGRKIQKALSGTPGVRWIAPFVKTLINVFNESLVSRSPIGLLSSQMRADLRSGGARGDLARARLAMGTMTMLGVAMMVKSGRIVGGQGGYGPERKIRDVAGQQPYSFIIRNEDGTETRQSFQRFEPISMLMGATADMTEILIRLDEEGELSPDTEEMVGQGLMAVMAGIAENTINKSVLVGVSDFFQAAGDPERYGMNYLKGFGTSMVPYVSLRRDLVKLSDPHVRQAWTLVDKIKATIPGLSDDVPPARDVLGNPRSHKTGSLVGPLSILPDRETSDGLVEQELVYLMESSKRIPLGMPSKSIEGLKLTSSEYEELVYLSRKGIEIGGMTFYERLENRINSRIYLNATLDDRVDMLKSIQSDYDKRARKYMEENNPSYAVRIEDHRNQKRANEARYQ